MAEGAEVAKAFVTLIPSFRGGKKAIEKELGGVIVPASKRGGLRGGAAAAAAIGASIRKVGLPIVAAAGATLGVALTKGMGRLMAIEDAQAKLRALGHDAKSVETIMTNALAAVKGTAFGLDEAATIAASVVAAGVKPGRELEKTLKLVADAATVAGADMRDMGSIFNQVAAGNRLTMEEVNRLTDRGIPILQFLAKELGVTALEVKDLVSEGEVDFKTFRKVIEDNMAGAALESGNTTRGALANVQAALARFGAALLSGIFPHIRTFFGQLIVWIDALTEKVGPFAEKLSKNLGGAFRSVIPYMQAFFRGLQGWTAGGGGPFATFNKFGQLIRQSFQAAAPVLKSIAQNIQSSLLPALMNLGKALLPIGAAIVGFFQQIAPSIGMVAQTVIKFVSSLMPTVQQFVTKVVGVLVPALRDIGALIKNEVAPTLVQFLNFIRPAVQWILSFVGDALIGALKGAVQVIQGALNIIVGLMKLVMAVVRGDWSSAWGAVKQIAEGIWNGIVGAFKVFINIGVGKAFKLGAKALMATGSGLWNGLRALFTAGPNLIMKMIRTLWSTVSGLFSKGANAISQSAKKGVTAVLNWFKKMPTQIWNAIKNIPTRVAQAFSNAARGATNAIKQLPKMITGAVSNAGSWLLNSGKEIIRGLIRGITSMAGNVKKAVKDVLQRARNLLPFSPAKEGPFSGKGWTLYSGRSIVEGLMQGIEQKESALRQTLEKTLTGPQLALSSGSLSVVGGDTHVTVILDGEPIRATVRSEIRRNNRDIYRAYSSGIGGAR